MTEALIIRGLLVASALLLDLVFGDPRGFPHLVVGFGKLITVLERALRACFPKSPGSEKTAGFVLVFIVILLAFLVPWLLILVLKSVSLYLAFAFELFLAWQCLALRSLKKESLLVYQALVAKDLPAARHALSMIVGRDTAALDEAAISRATVETIAENSSDGVIAPLLYLALGGGPLAVLYKAINTMDSMIAYKNTRYLHVGYAAAKLDDLANFIPARLTALMMILAARPAGYNAEHAWHIFKRDRYQHSSPNSAQSEAACAGALGLRLGGPATYFGQIIPKPYIGDALREIEAEDVVRANRLLYWTTALCALVIFSILGLMVWL